MDSDSNNLEITLALVLAALGSKPMTLENLHILVEVSSTPWKQLDCHRLEILDLLIGPPFLQSLQGVSSRRHFQYVHTGSSDQLKQRDFQQHFARIAV